MTQRFLLSTLGILPFLVVTAAHAQPPGDGPPGQAGFGRGPGGFGPMNRPDLNLVDKFDENGDGWLNLAERKQARAEATATNQPRGGWGFGPGGPGGFGGPNGPRRGPFGRDMEPAKPGKQVRLAEVAVYPNAELYDPAVLRTLLLTFEEEDWEEELEAFKNTDVDVPAELVVDGKSYPQVGVKFRGMSSYMMTPRGRKRSLNLSLDLVDEDQRLYGYKTLNLLNCNGDPSLMSAVLYSHIARQYTPAPRANFVHVVINGESWGVYANVQQFDKIFVKESFGSEEGARWKAPGSPGGDAGLRFTGNAVGQYQTRFELKSGGDKQKSWKSLVDLCRVLNETPLDELQAKLEPILDIDNVLRFLALDVALVNSDGYWTRASDYNLYRDAAGVFHVVPHDMNEAFHGSRRGGPGARGRGPRPDGAGGPQEGRSRTFGGGPPSPETGAPPIEDGANHTAPDDRQGGPADRDERFAPPQGFGPPGPDAPRGFGPPNGFGPPGFFGPPGAGGPQRGFGPPNEGGADLDPLVGVENPRMPLRSRLLALPELREKYLAFVREIADRSLDWKEIGPFVEAEQKLIAETVSQETRGLASFDEFEAAVAELRQFFEKRREFLLNYTPPEGDEQAANSDAAK